MYLGACTSSARSFSSRKEHVLVVLTALLAVVEDGTTTDGFATDVPVDGFTTDGSVGRTVITREKRPPFEAGAAADAPGAVGSFMPGGRTLARVSVVVVAEALVLET